VHKPFYLFPPRLTIPTHPLRPPPNPLPLHLVLTIRIPSAFFNGTQVASPHPVVPNSIPSLQSVRSLQETNLSSSRNFQVPGYSVFRADRTLTRWGPTTAGNQNGEEVLTLINSDLSFQMVLLPILTLSDPVSDYLCIKINFQKRSPLPQCLLHSHQKHSTRFSTSHLLP